MNFVFHCALSGALLPASVPMPYAAMREKLMEFLSIEEGFDVSTAPWGFGAQLWTLRPNSIIFDYCGAQILRDAVACRLAVQTALATTGIPLESQQQLGRDLDTVHDPRVLHTLAVLARDLTSYDYDRLPPTPSEMFVSHVLLRETERGQQLSELDSVAKLQLHLEGLEEAHWWLLAPLLRNRVLRHPIEQRSSWIFLLLRAIDAPVLGILRKQDALVLAKWLLKARCTGTGPREISVTGTRLHTIPDRKRELTALLGAMERAHGFEEPTRAVLRVAVIFTPTSPSLTQDLRLLLPGHCHVPPPCSPLFEPLTADLPASSEPVALLVDTLARLGTDALSLTLLPRMTLRAKRTAACSCRGLRTLIAPHLRSATLHVLAEDATLDNAAFVARLPSLERLHVEGESFLCDGLDIPKLRSLPRLALKTIGAPAALFLGYLLRGGEHTIRLSNGLSCISLQPLTIRDSLSLAVATAADLAVLLCSLSNNRALQQLELPLIFYQNERRASNMDAVDGLGDMLVQLGHAIRVCLPVWTRSHGRCACSSC